MRKKENFNVLVVDDEKAFLDQAKTFLEKSDDRLKILTADSAKTGLQIFEDENLDAMVSDFQMPENNGIEFLEEIREKRESDIPFIMLTGRGREEIAMKALNLGADRYLQKTGDPKTQFEILAKNIIKEAEKITEEMYRDVMKYNPNASLILSEDMMIESANEGFLNMVGMERENVVESPLSEIIDEEENKLQKLHFNMTIDQKANSNSYHTVLNLEPREEKDVMVSISPLKGSKKSIVNFFDVTEWAANEELMSEIQNFEPEGSRDLTEVLTERFGGLINQEKIKEDIQKNCLKELTILMIANRGRIHGKKIMDEFRNMFGLSISSGTMYPILYELEENGILKKHEGVKSKKYSLNHESEAMSIARDKIKSVFSQYLLLYQLYKGYSDRD
ncbi:MAG: response regulator [Thermoplasmata archaeon]